MASDMNRRNLMPSQIISSEEERANIEQNALLALQKSQLFTAATGSKTLQHKHMQNNELVPNTKANKNESTVQTNNIGKALREIIKANVNEGNSSGEQNNLEMDTNQNNLTPEFEENGTLASQYRWQTVKDKKRKLSDPKSENNKRRQMADIETQSTDSNRFEALNSLNENYVEMEQVNNVRDQNLNHNLNSLPFNNNANINIKATGEGSTIPSKIKIPPIIVKNINGKLLSDFIINNKLKATFTNLNPSTSKIYPGNIQEKQIFLKLLAENKIECYTYSASFEKPINILLKGIHHCIEPAHIAEALKKAFPALNPRKVSRFQTIKSKREEYQLDTFLIQLNPGEDITQLINTKHLLGQGVTWEALKGRGPIQCYRCQQFGHIAINCLKEYKCVKCLEKHPPNECNLNKVTGATPSCVNCGQEGHPANYRGCPMYKKFRKDRKERMMKSKPLSREKFLPDKVQSSTTRTGISYRNALLNLPQNVENNSFPPINDNRTPKIQDFHNLVYDLFGVPLQEIFNKINAFMDSISKYNSIPQKREAMLLFILNMCHNV